MNKIAALLTEESKVIFTDGTIITGAEEVAKFCVRLYTQAHLQGFKRGVIAGTVGVITVGVVGVGVAYGTKRNKQNLI
jgi:hypothetical protein